MVGWEPMSVVLCVLFGLPLLALGVRRRRRRATICGVVLLALAAGEVLYLGWIIRTGGRVPEIPAHSVAVLPLSFGLAVVGNRDLKSRSR